MHFKTRERKHQAAEEMIPKDPDFEGIFAVFVSRALAWLWEVKQFENGSID